MRRALATLLLALLVAGDARAQPEGTSAPPALAVPLQTCFMVLTFYGQFPVCSMSTVDPVELERQVSEYFVNGASVMAMPSGPEGAYFHDAASALAMPSEGPAGAYFHDAARVLAQPTSWPYAAPVPLAPPPPAAAPSHGAVLPPGPGSAPLIPTAGLVPEEAPPAPEAPTPQAPASPPPVNQEVPAAPVTSPPATAPPVTVWPHSSVGQVVHSSPGEPVWPQPVTQEPPTWLASSCRLKSITAANRRAAARASNARPPMPVV